VLPGVPVNRMSASVKGQVIGARAVTTPVPMVDANAVYASPKWLGKGNTYSTCKMPMLQCKRPAYSNIGGAAAAGESVCW